MQHAAVSQGSIHTPFNWVVANVAARDALTVSAADLYKACWVVADAAVHILTGVGPNTWSTVSGGSSVPIQSTSGFFAHRNNVNWAKTGVGTFEKIPWTHEDWDYNAEFDLVNSRFVPKTAGKYIFGLMGQVSGGGASDLIGMRIFKNGTQIAMIGNLMQNGSLANYGLSGVSPPLPLLTTDYVEAMLYANVGTMTLVGNKISTAFWGWRHE
jgi:hypothetical protein